MLDSKEITILEYLFALTAIRALKDSEIKLLKKHFGSVEAIFEASMNEIDSVPSISEGTGLSIKRVTDNMPAFNERLRYMRDLGMQVMCLEDESYPDRLKVISDSPILLCTYGALTEIDGPCVAVVGRRGPTREACYLALKIVEELVGAGYTVVSGLAEGIDTAVHAGTMRHSGRTIAVLAADVETIYPAKNRNLSEDIRYNGCLLSEYPFPTRSKAPQLIQRNRIITGLSLATIVVQFSGAGGSMHSARFTKSQHRLLIGAKWGSGEEREGTRALERMNSFLFTENEIDKVLEAIEKEKTKEVVVQSTW